MRRLPSAVLVLVLCSGCVLPAFGEGPYRGKAQTTAGAALSEVATAKLTVDQLLRGRLPGPYADEVVSASETALGAIGEAFSSVQPPPASDGIRDEVTGAVDDAAQAVAAARIATRRGDRDALGELAGRLGRIAEQLSGLEERLA